MNKKNLVFLLLAFFLLISLIGCTQTQTLQETSKREDEKTTVLFTLKYFDENGKTIVDESSEVQKGTNAFEAMKSKVEVDYDLYAIGAFVKGINGVFPPKGYYLALYVNGEYARKGISGYTVNNDMTVEWKTEKIESFKLN